ncbi:hypothetical protein KR032_005287 [Drosophila birchii]|nr:hypothetical protein KR032_005287 [Drosophila birchii]
MKDFYYRVPEITVSELCRTLTGLKALEEAKNTNPKDNSAQANKENGKSQPNEPFFASNLEYYPHLPQVYYSEEYQTFAELKASVCKGDLTQVKPPIDNDYHFISEWREANMTPEQRQAYLRNQRALTAQRIGRHERLRREQEGPQEQKSSQSEGTAKKDKHRVQDWLNTCKQVEQQRKFRLQQAMNAGFYMRDWRGMRSETRRQELEKEKEVKKQQEPMEREESKIRRQDLEKKSDLKNPQQEQKKLQEPEACFFKKLNRLSARSLNDQNGFVKRQMEQKEKEEKKLQEIGELNELDEQELEARIQKQKKSMEFVAQLQKEFDEQKQKEEDEARRHLEQKMQQEKEAERDLIQARLRNERAKTAQQKARETRRYYEQRQFDFRFGPKEDMDQACPDVTSEHLPKMPTVPRAPVPSKLPQFNGKAPTGTGTGN